MQERKTQETPAGPSSVVRALRAHNRRLLAELDALRNGADHRGRPSTRPGFETRWGMSPAEVAGWLDDLAQAGMTGFDPMRLRAFAGAHGDDARDTESVLVTARALGWAPPER